MAISPLLLSQLILGGLMFILAAALLIVARQVQAARIFAAVLVIIGGFSTCFALAVILPGEEARDLAWKAVGLLVIPAPLLVLYFASVFPRRRPWVPDARWTGVGVAAACTALLAVYLWDPGLYWGAGARGPEVGLATGPMAQVNVVLSSLVILVPVVLIAEYVRMPAGARRSQTLLLALFFGVVIAIHATGRVPVAPLVSGVPVFEPIGAAVVTGAVSWLWLFEQLVVLGFLGYWSFKAPTAAVRRGVGYVTVILVLLVVSRNLLILGENASGTPELWAMLNQVWHGAWDVGLALIVTFGILRHQLFDIELKVKRTVKHGSVVAALAAVYVLTSFGAKAFMSPDAAQNTGIVLTGLMLFALVPLQRLGGRLADAAMPGVRDDRAYLDQRRLEVYRAALEDARGPDGQLEAGERDRLVRMREQLGLSDRDHAILLMTLQSPGAGTVLPTFEAGRTVLSRYRIEEVLGEGGQGTTYKALDTTLGREVVLKVLHGIDTRGLLREARALARIDHPNVVTIFDVERVGDHVYLVMEHVDGGSLKEKLRTGALDEAPFQRLASDLLSGLEAVHEAGLVHRDVKPSNVLLTLDGRAKVADLGIATTTEPSEQTTLGAGSTSARGTIAYMSPEQARGDKLTPASDLFSAGLVLYEAYTGRPLFKPRPGESMVELQARVARWSGFDGDLEAPDLDRWLSKALAPTPEDRYPDTVSMRERLPVASVPPTRGRSS